MFSWPAGFFPMLTWGVWSFRSWSAKPTHPLLVQSKEYFSHLDLNHSLSEYGFVVLDTELTGLNIKKDELVSLGAVRIKEMRIDIQDSLYLYTCPSKEVPKQSTLIHYITPEQVRQAPPLEDMLLKLLDYCGHSLIVGHNIKLDMSVINRDLRKYFGGVLNNLCIDTMHLARIYLEGPWGGGTSTECYDPESSYNLRKLSQDFGLPLFPEHDALADAMQTAYLFLFLVHKLQGNSTWSLKDLYKAAGSKI